MSSLTVIAALAVTNLVLLILAIAAFRLLRRGGGADRQALLESDELFAYDSWASDRAGGRRTVDEQPGAGRVGG